jgi:hypothetical protein
MFACSVLLSVANAGATVVPPELIGPWTHMEWQAGTGHFDPDKVTDPLDYRNQDPVAWTDSYRFFDDGTYQHAHYTSLDIPGCDAKTLRQEIGVYHIDGSLIRIENRTAKASAQDRCHGQNNFEGRPDRPVLHYVLEWRVVKDRKGQPLLFLKSSDGKQIAYHRNPSGHI